MIARRRTELRRRSPAALRRELVGLLENADHIERRVARDGIADSQVEASDLVRSSSSSRLPWPPAAFIDLRPRATMSFRHQHAPAGRPSRPLRFAPELVQRRDDLARAREGPSDLDSPSALYTRFRQRLSFGTSELQAEEITVITHKPRAGGSSGVPKVSIWIAVVGRQASYQRCDEEPRRFSSIASMGRSCGEQNCRPITEQVCEPIHGSTVSFACWIRRGPLTQRDEGNRTRGSV